jgi:hypothetical protein
MQNHNPIDITLCRRIAYEEWKNFKKSQDIAIGARLRKDTGLLHAGGAGRRYSIATNKNEIVASLLHPDYLRYQDMRKLKHGRTNSKLHTPKITQTKGKGIHNRMIWGRMNTIAFRCMNDLRGEVIKFVRSSKITKRKLTFKI